MENAIKENNNETATTINKSVNETLKYLQITTLKIVEKMITK